MGLPDPMLHGPTHKTLERILHINPPLHDNHERKANASNNHASWTPALDLYFVFPEFMARIIVHASACHRVLMAVMYFLKMNLGR